MKQLIIGVLLAVGVTAANAHVIGTIMDGDQRITLTDKHSCKGCEYEASTTAPGMDVIWNYTDIDGIIEVDQSDGVHMADVRQYNLSKDVHLTVFGKRFIGQPHD